MDLQFSADLPMLQQWARGIMCSRNPDLIIGENYLHRWWVIPRNPLQNVYLHRFYRSDEDRALHDHPFASTSVILEGGYYEHTEDEIFIRNAGDIVKREAEAAHRVELFAVEGKAVPCTSLFFTGPVVRDWGFHCPQGWVHHDDFNDPEHPGRPGKGCGE